MFQTDPNFGKLNTRVPFHRPLNLQPEVKYRQLTLNIGLLYFKKTTSGY